MSITKLKAVLKDKHVVYGSERTLKNLKLGKAKAVFLASNCPGEVKDKIKSYDVEVIELDIPNDELALICKRPHNISVLSH